MKRAITRYENGTPTDAVDDLVEEGPVEYRLGGVPLAVLMRTPGEDTELGLGFAITEGIVISPDEVVAVTPVPGADNGDRYTLDLAHGVEIDPEQFRRNLFASSSCGVCGKASIDAVRVTARHVPDGPVLTPDLITALPAKMRSQQQGFATSGSVHAAAAFDDSGDLIVLREDIGRHNAVDKLVGHIARDQWPFNPLILVVSGRISFEMVQKAAVAGIPFICGVSGASTLAAELGSELGVTVIGFLRGQRFNVYSGGHRISR